MSEQEIFKFFPEAIFKYKLEDFKNLNKELSEYIYKLQAEDKDGLEKSNKGGWHSRNFELTVKSSVQNRFAIIIQKYILKVFNNNGWKTENKNIRIKEMWAIINKNGDFNILHTHPNCYLSAVYYVKATEKCGKFQIENPNIAKRNFYPEIKRKNELNLKVAGIEIEEGDLLIFPGYLPHKVSTNESNQDRVVISFNVDIKG